MSDMTCTRCFRPAGEAPTFDDLPLHFIIELCEGWLCPDCLDEEEAISAEDQP